MAGNIEISSMGRPGKSYRPEEDEAIEKRHLEGDWEVKNDQKEQSRGRRRFFSVSVIFKSVSSAFTIIFMLVTFLLEMNNKL